MIAPPTGTNWICTTGTKLISTITYSTVICNYTLPLLAGTTAPTITVLARVDSATPLGTALRNIAYVCRTGDTSPECTPACLDTNNPTCTPPPPPTDCNSPDVAGNKDPACVVTTTTTPSLNIKKAAQ